MLFTLTIKGTEVTREVDTGKIPDDFMEEIVKKGLEAVLNGRGRGKLGKITDHPTSEAAWIAEAAEIFDTQLTDLYEGRTRFVGKSAKKAKGADAAVQSEMLRVAKLYAREQVKSGAITDDGGNLIKLGTISAAMWTKTAKAYIEHNPDHFRKIAEANLAAAASVTLGDAPKITMSADPKKVKAAAKAKADAKAKRDAEKAGKTPPPKPGNKKPAHVRAN
jgi:hypothetical protein